MTSFLSFMESTLVIWYTQCQETFPFRSVGTGNDMAILFRYGCAMAKLLTTTATTTTRTIRGRRRAA
jgi:hypothetical protein